MHNYKAAITSSLMWVQEARLSAQYIIDGYSRNELCALSREENIYNAPSDDRKRKIANTTYDRIKKLPEEMIQELATCDYDSAKLIVLLSMMLWDDLFHDFMIEIFKPKVVLGLDQITNGEVQLFVQDLKSTYPSAAKISEASEYKIAQTFIKFLIEAGLVDNAKEGNIKKPYIDYRLYELLDKYGYRDFITIITGD